jgi:hypothetical protein
MLRCSGTVCGVAELGRPSVCCVVDLTYRTELRELNEQNFARFDAKLEQRLAELSARIDGVAADLHAVLERRLGEQTRWFFVAWASLLVPIIGLWFRR